MIFFGLNTFHLFGRLVGLRRAPLRSGFLFAEKANKRTKPFASLALNAFLTL
jgi:hypothetical protein